MAPRAVLPGPHIPSAHAAHPNFRDPGRQQKILKNRWRSRPATESPHLALRPPWTDPLELKMCHLGSLKRPFSSKNGDSGVLLRTHYLLCFHCINPLPNRLRTMWRPALDHSPRLVPCFIDFLAHQCLPGPIWGLKWVTLKPLLCPKMGLGISGNHCRQHSCPPWGLKVLSRVPTDPSNDQKWIKF